MHPDTTGVTFLARSPDDKYLCDNKSQWWHEWHEYKLDDNNVPVYGARMMSLLKQNLKLKKYMLWSDSVHLTDAKYFIHDSFNYDAHDDFI